MAQLELTNVINISVSAAQTGIGAYNTSNLAVFTRETAGSGFGSLGYKLYLDPTDVATDFGTNSVTYAMALSVFSQQPNILTGDGTLVVIPFLSGEALNAAITRTKDLVQYFGVLAAEITASTPGLAAAAVVQALRKILFLPQKDSSLVAPGAYLDELRSGGFSQTRGLLYVNSAVDQDTLVMAAAYASRALSTDFSGSNTTQTMHLKDLAGVQPDSQMTQTLLGQCVTAGVDVYASFQGVSKVFTSGANTFFDRIYNRIAFVAALEVAGFNALAESSSKLAQTEDGLSVLKGAYRRVCEQYVGNQFLAPGAWTDPTSFGIPADFIRNVSERGYYMYSIPVAQQNPTDRAARKAPLIQIAGKEAGAIHESDVIIYVNA